MRTCLALLVLSSSAIPAFAQLATLPERSGADGIFINPATPLNASWASSALADYWISPSNPFTVPSAGGLDSYGHRWGSSAPSMPDLNIEGGTLRNIFLGSSSSVNAVGYTYSGSVDSTDSFTLAYNDGSYAPSEMTFGNYADVPLVPGDRSVFDFWISTQNGAYTVFDPANSIAPFGQAQVLWTEAPLLISTFIPALGANAYIETWIVSVIEQSVQNQPPLEYRFAVQQFVFNAPNPVPIPEPSTYAAFGLIGCALLAVRRKLLARRRAVSQKD